MASTIEFVEYIAGRFREAGTVAYRPMFGGYGLYLDGKYFACVCGNRLFVKITQAGRALNPACPTGRPYEGGSPMLLIENPEDAAFLVQLAQATCSELPAPKPRRRKKEDAEI